MVGGIRGHRYSSEFQWEEADMLSISNANQSNWYQLHGDDIAIYCSEDLYDDWNLDPEMLFANDQEAESDTDTSSDVHKRVNGNYIGIVFETKDDRGIIGSRKKDTSDSPALLNVDNRNQWVFDYSQSSNEVDGSGNSRVCISVINGGDSAETFNPNDPSSMIGVMYPWGMRPTLKRREEAFDLYEYGADGEDWTQDD